MSQLRISRTERVIAFINTVLAGLGIGVGVGISTYGLITAGVGTGAGLGVVVVSAPLWITVACVGSGLIGMGIGWYSFREYEKNAEKLLEEIESQKQEIQSRREDFLVAQHLYTVLALRRNFMRLQYQDVVGKQHMVTSPLTEDPSYLPKLVAELKSKHPDIVKVLSSQGALTPDQDHALQQLSMPHYQASLKEYTTLKSKKQASIAPSVATGLITSLATFGAVLATSWGVASLVLGAGLAVTALAATPFLGWGILAGSIALGLAVGGAVAYYKYKNTKREVKRDNIKTINNNLIGKIDEIKDGQILLSNQNTHLDTMTRDNEVKILRQQVQSMQTKIATQKELIVNKDAVSDAHLSDIQHLFNHKNDPNYIAENDKKDRDEEEDNKGEGLGR